MDTMKFEKLDDVKFRSLTQEEMREFDAGCKRWRVEEVVISFHPIYGEISEERRRRYTLFGRATDEWEVRWVE